MAGGMALFASVVLSILVVTNAFFGIEKLRERGLVPTGEKDAQVGQWQWLLAGAIAATTLMAAVFFSLLKTSGESAGCAQIMNGTGATMGLISLGGFLAILLLSLKRGNSLKRILRDVLSAWLLFLPLIFSLFFLWKAGDC